MTGLNHPHGVDMIAHIAARLAPNATLTEDVRWLREQEESATRWAGIQERNTRFDLAADHRADAARYARIREALETHLHNAATIASGDDAPVVSLSERRSAAAPGVGLGDSEATR